MVKYIRIQSVFCMKKRLVYKEGDMVFNLTNIIKEQYEKNITVCNTDYCMLPGNQPCIRNFIYR